jgi:hypothetical protein
MMRRQEWIEPGIISSCEDYTATEGVTQSQRDAPFDGSSKEHPPAKIRLFPSSWVLFHDRDTGGGIVGLVRSKY